MINVDKSMINIGTFDVVSGKLRITDPCYDKKDNSYSSVIDVRNGKWDAFIVMHDDRPFKLIAMHEHVVTIRDYQWEFLDNNISVDSGQAGIFDESHYQDHSIILEDPDEDFCNDRWYSACCCASIMGKNNGESSAGVIPFGAVSSSGYGDGEYSCYIHKNSDGMIDAVMIDFQDEYEDEDEDDDYEEDEDY